MPSLRCHQACLLSCRYDSDDYSQYHIDQKTGEDWRQVYSTPEKHPCYDPSKVPALLSQGGVLLPVKSATS